MSETDGPKSNDGTVTGRPDEGYRFVVERPAVNNPTGDPEGAWVYTDVYESQSDAVRAAEAVTGPVRVRAFAQAVMPKDHAIAHEAYSRGPVSGTDVPMQMYECVDHADQRISVPASARAPRCPQCRTSMATPAMAAKLRAMGGE